MYCLAPPPVRGFETQFKLEKKSWIGRNLEETESGYPEPVEYQLIVKDPYPIYTWVDKI